MLEAATPHAAKRLIEALDATRIEFYRGLEVGEYVDHSMRITAAQAILDRLYGKAPQAITGDDGGPISLGVVILPADDPAK